MLETTQLRDGSVHQQDRDSWAVLSGCSRYRYLLGRYFGRSDGGNGTCLFVMLNPSTADALTDDPTIRRCINFAKRWGYEELRVVNQFGYRSPHPKVLLTMADPEGPLNADYVASEVQDADRIILAWGNGGGVQRELEFLDVCDRHARVTPRCLGTTKQGSPKHPLARGRHWIPDDFEPVPFLVDPTENA